jgi:4-hydroxythreonine-4-phosphate dehydrogenase
MPAKGGSSAPRRATVIKPAIDALCAEGIAVSGPHSADTLFHAEARQPTTRPSPCITTRR